MANIRFWALCCVPDVYDGFGAARELDVLCWTLDRGEPMPGDKIIVWQAKGKSKHGRRGIIALGEVIMPPQMLAENEAEYKFWQIPPELDPVMSTQFRVLRLPNIPLWENEHFDLLSNLSVAKARGGTVFNVTPEQWESVLALARNEPVTLLNEPAAGQGFGLTAAERKLIEMHAQAMARTHFKDVLGYQVDDRSLTEAYDLHCTLGDETLFVEVKGTTGSGDSIFLTRNEVELSRRNPKLMALFLVRNIKLVDAGTETTAIGGEFQLVMPWNVDEFNPEALQFQCSIPKLS